MRLLAAVPLVATLAHGLNLSGVLSANPELSSKTPAPSSTVNREVIANSIVAKLNKSKPTPSDASKAPNLTPTPKPTTKKGNPSKKTSSRKTSSKKATATKNFVARAEIFTVKPGVLALASPIVAADGNCAPQTNLYSYTPSVNTPKGFLVDTTLAAVGAAARPPPGYTANFTNAFGSIFAPDYLSYYQLSSYDVSACSALCDKIPSCQSFNIYFERDPVLDPGPNCANPTAGVTVRCAMYGSQIVASQAQNVGEWRSQFMVVIQSSAGYSKNNVPAAVPDFTGPTGLGGAINVDTLNGKTVLLAQNYQSGTYDPSVCASQCTALTAKNKAAGIAAGAFSYAPCNYFNAFSISQNGVRYGYYCSLYTDAAVASTTPQYTSTYNGVTYDLTNSWGYALSVPDSGSLPLPQFRILSAYLADANITASARAAFLSNNNTVLNINTAWPSTALGSSDPWSGNTKSISILYTYGSNETRVWAGIMNTGSFNQTNAYFGTTTAAGSSLVPTISAPSSATVKLAGIAYGPIQIATASVYANIYAAASSKSSFAISNGFFGIDPYYGLVKSGVVWYYNAAGVLLALAGRENTNVAFPS
ncbi:hypothetical protein CAC42_8275 [Sphaceloma murrayae]|uniref:Uncharacterized protein n=1 Tax=Sphaceloma murrayae TaxID=2082308 RepID=A0A2K1QJC7_9PEZI|nr:hypothetical protein CAC42_8275 [Sphaceloma murrayae]